MPPKRKRGAAPRGKPKEKQEDRPETEKGLTEEDGEGDDSMTEEKLLEENASELDMSVDLDESQEENLIKKAATEVKSDEDKEAKDTKKGAEDGTIGEDSKDKKADIGEDIMVQMDKEENRKIESKEAAENKKEDNKQAEGGEMESKEEEKAESEVKLDIEEEGKKGSTTEEIQETESKTGDKIAKTKAEENTVKENGDNSKKDAGSEKKAARVGLLETPARRSMEVFDSRAVKVMPIASFEVKEMQSRWKWSIRISPVKPEDVMTSELMTMPRVQDAYYYVSQQHDGTGQMELCTKTTNDTILAMLRILRSPFTNRVVTIELTKRSYVKMETVGVDAGPESTTSPTKAPMPETKPVQESADGETSVPAPSGSEDGGKAADVKKEAAAKEEEKEMEEEDEEGEPSEGVKSGFGATTRTPVWGEAKETGDVVRRSVYVGTMPKSTTEEMLKVIFPIANSIIMKPADEPNMRHAFIETSTRSNAVGFVTSYLGLIINSQELKLSIKVLDLQTLKRELAEDSEKKEKDTKKEEGEAEVETKEADDKKDEKDVKEAEDVEMKAAQEENEDADGKTKESEKAEEGKTEGKGVHKEKRELSEEEKRHKSQLNRQKKKRKREFIEEVHREWSAKRSRQDMDMPGPSPLYMGPRYPFGPGQRRGMLPFGRGDLPAPPPLFQIQDKIANLLRLQNQLEKTISTQMEFIHHSEAAARHQAEMRIRDMAMMSHEFGFEEPRGGLGKGASLRGRGFQGGGKFSGIVGRSFGGPGGKGGEKQHDFLHSPSHSDGSGESHGFPKRFRRESDSRYENRGSQGDVFKGGKNFQGGSPGNVTQGQRKFKQGDSGFGGHNTSFASDTFGEEEEVDSGNQFGGSSFGSGSDFGGGKGKFGRGGKFGDGADQMGAGTFGDGKFENEGNQKGGGKPESGKKSGGGGGNFGGSGNKFGTSGNKMGGRNKFGGDMSQMGSGKNFGRGGMNTGSNFGGNKAGSGSTAGPGSWGTGSISNQSFGGTNFGSGFGSGGMSGNYSSAGGFGSFNSSNSGGGNFSAGSFGMGTGSYGKSGGAMSSTSYGGAGSYVLGRSGMQQSWNSGQNQMGGSGGNATFGSMQTGFSGSSYNTGY